ncbi:adenylate cyclase [Bifidobacterium margollesii]|uniref:Adenylate cyclase n=1 Tax=Bifidobacterium margollesii TaxID=2020964 RepID=A0A2N5JB97_9BIFI|nr:hypothetical protein [Bifidobacterium margollesii]PLS31475.1 adenylate cyclase [Bifidobacterium margollesii]
MSDEFEYERRFFCRSFPTQYDDGDSPLLIVQNYYVHQDGFALRIRMQAHGVRLDMSQETDGLTTLLDHRDAFDEAFVTVKGTAVGGTRYEAARQIDPNIALELMLRGGVPIVKNRFSVWLDEDGWDIDVFGANNAPLIIAEVERSSPVTNLTIPDFCTSEVTDDQRFYNDGLASKPFGTWKDEYFAELDRFGPQFSQLFGRNRRRSNQSL